MRGIDREAASLKAGRWQTGLGSNLRGKTLAVVGLGNIGREIARKYPLGCSPSPASRLSAHSDGEGGRILIFDSAVRPTMTGLSLGFSAL
jgi:glutamate dehydrogenase/leucine dehydrogenase